MSNQEQHSLTKAAQNADFISLLNLWCQKNKHSLPEYTFSGHPNRWKAQVLLPNQRQFQGNVYGTKKEAKQAVAKIAYQQILEENRVEIKKELMVLVDGDQRADCWRWLAEQDFPPGFKVRVYTGPVTPIIECPNIEICRTMSPAKDSADAKMLMDLGGLLATTEDRFLIISSDHILVQAAQETDRVDWVGNLAQLKKFLV